MKSTRNKYNARRGSVAGKRFDSTAEVRRFAELSRLLRLGKISDLKRQVPYELIPAQYDEDGRLLERAVTYKADFVYSRDGVTVVEDVKGAKTKDYVLKRKLMLYIHKIRLVEIEERKK